MYREGIMLYRNSAHKVDLTINEEGVLSDVNFIQSCFTKDYLENYNNELYPPNCRFISTGVGNYNMTRYFLEFKPEARTIKVSVPYISYDMNYMVSNGHDPEILQNFVEKYKVITKDSYLDHYLMRLQFPYLVFKIDIVKNRASQYSCNNISVYFRKSPLKSTNDILCLPSLPNIFTDMNMCIPKSTNCSSSIEAIDTQISLFWDSTFNTDANHLKEQVYQETPFDDKYHIIGNFVHWAMETEKNPLFIFTESFKGYSKISDLCPRSDNVDVDIFSKFDELLHKYNTKRESVHFEECSNGMLVSAGDVLDLEDYGKVVVKHFTSDGFSVLTIVKDDSVIKIRRDELFSRIIMDEEDILEELTINGRTIKIGDILTCNDRFVKVDGISMDNKVGLYRIIQFNPGYKAIKKYLTDYFVSNFKYAFEDLPIGEEVYMQSNNSLDEHILMKGTLLRVDVEGSTSIYIIKMDNYEMEYYSNNYKYPIRCSEFEMELIEQPVFTSGRIYANFEGSYYKHYIKDEKIYSVRTMSIDENSYRKINSGYFTNIVQQFYNEETNEIFIKSLDPEIRDINIKIGTQMIIPRRIYETRKPKIGQVVNIRRNDNGLYLGLGMDDTTAANILYIQFRTNSSNRIVSDGWINCYTYRRNINTFKITETKSIQIGDKIRAHVSKIPDFPKTHVNTIEAILVDRKRDPIIMCSNGRSLYLRDILKNFTVIPRGSNDYDTTKNAINYKFIERLNVDDLVSNSINVYRFNCISRGAHIGRPVQEYNNGTSRIYNIDAIIPIPRREF